MMKGRSRRGKQSSEQLRFRVVVATGVDAKVRDSRTPRKVREAYVRTYRDAAKRGCEAAHYRLSGPGNWPRFCVVRLPDNWRLVVVFPDTDTVVFLLLERHDNRADPYDFLEQAFELPSRAGHGAGATGAKPSCCTDQAHPPLSEDAELMTAIDEIVRRRR